MTYRNDLGAAQARAEAAVDDLARERKRKAQKAAAEKAEAKARAKAKAKSRPSRLRRAWRDLVDWFAEYWPAFAIIGGAGGVIGLMFVCMLHDEAVKDRKHEAALAICKRAHPKSTGVLVEQDRKYWELRCVARNRRLGVVYTSVEELNAEVERRQQ